MSDLKSGRKKSLSSETLSRISQYLGVSVDYLLTGEEKEKPAVSGERVLEFDDFTYALYDESKELPPEKKQMLLEMARFMRQEMDKKDGK